MLSKNKRKKPEQDLLGSNSDNDWEKFVSKRLKETETNLNELFENFDKNTTESIINFLKEQYPKHEYSELPILIYIHQIYSLIKSKTLVDREVEILKNENKIYLFKSDNQSDICICEAAEFSKYVKQIADSETSIFKSIKIDKQRFMFLIDLYLNKIIIENNQLSIEKSLLKTKYQLNDMDLTCLVHFGLLTIKDISNFWISIPRVGNFRQDLLVARKSLMNIIRKKKYNEVSIEELIRRNSKKISKIGISYLICDLIGSELLKRIDSPICLKVKLND